MANPAYPPNLLISRDGYKEGHTDFTVRDDAEAPYTFTRAVGTRRPKKWSYRHDNLTDTQKSTMRTFIDSTVKGTAGLFDWTDPTDSTIHTVRFTNIGEWEYQGYYGGSSIWGIGLSIQEV